MYSHNNVTVCFLKGAGVGGRLYCSQRIHKKLGMRTEWLRDRLGEKTVFLLCTLTKY